VSLPHAVDTDWSKEVPDWAPYAKLPKRTRAEREAMLAEWIGATVVGAWSCDPPHENGIQTFYFALPEDAVAFAEMWV
jgi:hypothetical protein